MNIVNFKDKEKYQDIHQLETDYFKRAHSAQDSHNFLKKIYHLKKKYIKLDDSLAINDLNNFQDYVQHDINQITYINTGLLSLVSTIFLPLSFIVGFFGMNFKSMGSPTLKKGILNINHAEKFIFAISGIAIITIIAAFYFSEIRKTSVFLE